MHKIQIKNILWVFLFCAENLVSGVQYAASMPESTCEFDSMVCVNHKYKWDPQKFLHI